MKAVYYNENDPKAAAWLRELMAAGQIPAGRIDERSIIDVRATDLVGFRQCHFFAGIGGWPLALRLAGWPEDREVWTGSCPCQPFSSAGKGLGVADDRHLWPSFYRLIRERRPVAVFGEQVASAIGKGWLDGVSSDLESEGYACGSVVLGAHSVGAPHIRQRLFWVADPQHDGGRTNQPGREEKRRVAYRGIGGMAIAACGGSGPGLRDRESTKQRWNESSDGGEHGGLGDANTARLQARECEELQGARGREEGGATLQSGGSSTAWDRFDIIPCLDGKARRIESGTFPLAHGVPGRVGLLRGYGNAIIPELAAEFVKAFIEVTN